MCCCAAAGQVPAEVPRQQRTRSKGLPGLPQGHHHQGHRRSVTGAVHRCGCCPQEWLLLPQYVFLRCCIFVFCQPCCAAVVLAAAVTAGVTSCPVVTLSCIRCTLR